MKLLRIKDNGSHYWATAADGAAKCSVMIASDPNTRQWYVSGPNGKRYYITASECSHGAVAGARARVRGMLIPAFVA